MYVFPISLLHSIKCGLTLQELEQEDTLGCWLSLLSVYHYFGSLLSENLFCLKFYLIYLPFLLFLSFIKEESSIHSILSSMVVVISISLIF